jgi:hypothetical protein
MTIINTENRGLTLDELDTINGGEGHCVAKENVIRTDVGTMTFGIVDCGTGPVHTYVTWTPAP